jgi:hypothetical protein
MEFGAQAGMAILPQRAAAANDHVVFEGPLSAEAVGKESMQDRGG